MQINAISFSGKWIAVKLSGSKEIRWSIGEHFEVVGVRPGTDTESSDIYVTFKPAEEIRGFKQMFEIDGEIFRDCFKRLVEAQPLESSIIRAPKPRDSKRTLLAKAPVLRDTKLQADLVEHRKKRKAIQQKKEVSNRVRVLQSEPELAVLYEAVEIQTLQSIAKRLKEHCTSLNLEYADVAELVRSAKRMRNAAIARWLLSGMELKTVAEAFQITTVRASQIRKEVAKSEQGRKKS